MAEIYDYNTNASRNNSAAPDGFPEGMNYSEVNDAAREVMAVLARYIQTLGGVAMTGSNNAYAVNLAITGAHARGRLYILQANHTNTGPATLSINSEAPVSLQNPLGQALVAGQIINGGTHVILHDGTNFRVFGLLPTAGEVRLLPGITATETAAGLATIATQEEVTARTVATKFVTPATLPGFAAQADVNTGTGSTTIVTPATIGARLATETQTGFAALATQAEVTTGTNNDKIVTPLRLSTRLAGIPSIQAKVKASDQVITRSNTLTADPQLQGFSLQGGRRYAFKLFLAGVGGLNTGFRWFLDFTTDPQAIRGFTLIWASHSGVHQGFDRVDFTEPYAELIRSSTSFSFELIVEGSFHAAVADSTLDVQWAPIRDDKPGTTLYEGSYAQIVRVD